MATYKQPRRINPVTVVMALIAIAAIYVGYRAWPLVTLHGDVKSALDDALPLLYRGNLLPEPECFIATEAVRTSLIEKLTALGVVDPEKALTISRDAQEVSITAKLAVALDLGPIVPLARRRVPLTLRPSVRTSAARVEY